MENEFEKKMEDVALCDALRTLINTEIKKQLEQVNDSIDDKIKIAIEECDFVSESRVDEMIGDIDLSDEISDAVSNYDFSDAFQELKQDIAKAIERC